MKKLWTQLNKNGYVRNKGIGGGKAKKKKKVIKEEEEKEKNWYGITSIGQHTERIKAILRRE